MVLQSEHDAYILDGFGQRVAIFYWNKNTVFAIRYQIRNRADLCSNHWYASVHGFDLFGWLFI